MRRKYLALAGRIRGDISEIEVIVERTQGGWERARQCEDEYYLDSVALNLHSFYTALERVFELIAVTIEQTKPQGENWHQELLRQMATEIELLRPTVISKETRNRLDEYRGFRHVVRNVYSFNLSIAKVEPLVKELPSLFDDIRNELDIFLAFLEAAGSN
jgi:DNA gyrase/topoisomerase IV subunit A